MPNFKKKIPQEVLMVVNTLEANGYPAFLVGGCVRDLYLGIQPKDWDITTRANPEQIIPLFPKTVYENDFGTVTVVNEELALDHEARAIQITPFRLEAKYSDRRHPDQIKWSDKLEDDLARRDFTINALSYSPNRDEITDLYEGKKDIRDKIIRTVGDPDSRLAEDPLRILRGIRFMVQLDFTLNSETAEAMSRQAGLLKQISVERIREEFEKILLSPKPAIGLAIAHQLNILAQFIPEIELGIGVKQNGSHIYDVWEHTLRVLQHSADKAYPLHVRLAALFHDIAKPKTRHFSPENNDFTFYNHEVVGARMAKELMNRLRFPVKTTELVVNLVRNHMFFSDTDKITLSAVRRIITKVGRENIWDLIHLRFCDRIGMGRPKEDPYRLRKYEAMIEEALSNPTTVGMLKIDGNDVLHETGVEVGPKVGFILHALLEIVLEQPELNERCFLLNKAKELANLPLTELKRLGEQGKDKKEEQEQAKKQRIRSKYGV